jgi:nucleoporin SEH1
MSWNESPFEPAKLAIGGYSKRAVVWTQINSKWVEECILGTHSNTIHDVAWAPSMGKSYHLIATASRDPVFQIHTLIRKEGGALEYQSSEEIVSLNNSPVWRLAWNATGTVLATSSEDGTLSLWRKNFSGKWVNIKTLPADTNQFRSYYKI